MSWGFIGDPPLELQPKVPVAIQGMRFHSSISAVCWWIPRTRSIELRFGTGRAKAGMPLLVNVPQTTHVEAENFNKSL